MPRKMNQGMVTCIEMLNALSAFGSVGRLVDFDFNPKSVRVYQRGLKATFSQVCFESPESFASFRDVTVTLREKDEVGSFGFGSVTFSSTPPDGLPEVVDFNGQGFLYIAEGEDRGLLAQIALLKETAMNAALEVLLQAKVSLPMIEIASMIRGSGEIFPVMIGKHELTVMFSLPTRRSIKSGVVPEIGEIAVLFRPYTGGPPYYKYLPFRVLLKPHRGSPVTYENTHDNKMHWIQMGSRI